jgi:di/tricarboxylate transporter
MEQLIPFVVLTVVIGCFAALLLTKKEPELIFGSGLIGLLVMGAVTPQGAFSGFSNPGFLTVASLYILAAGIKETGLIRPLLGIMLRKSSNSHFAQLQITGPVAMLSSFLNNTPIVAALLPGINKWCADHDVSRRLYLLPLSYAAILGGTCTLIGTSTNLLVYGFVQQTAPESDLSFFDIGVVGLPLTLLGILYLSLFSKRILGEQKMTLPSLDNTREYTVEMLLSGDSPLVGKTVEQAKLRQLKGVYLIEIIRGDLVLAVVSPKMILHADDRLVFSGVVDSISDLLAIQGLTVAEDQVFKIGGETGRASLVEAVIGTSHPLVNKTVKEGNFRKKYNAAIIAVLREGQRIRAKIGEIRLKPGDTLLMLARRSFVEQHSYSRDFMLVSGNQELFLDAESKRPWAWIITLGFVVAAASGILSVVEAAVIAAMSMVFSGCVTLDQAKRSIDLQVLLTIAAAFGIGAALNESGAANLLASGILFLSGESPFALLVATYLMTMLLTELITNNAAAVIAYSLVSGLVISLGYNIVPYAITIMIAASASFMSPLGYQTNLMVYSAGRYQFADYLKLGFPLSLLSALLTLFIIPLVWDLN